MEKTILYLVLFAGYILYQVYKASNNKAKQQQAKGTKKPNKNVAGKQADGQVFKELGLDDLFKQIQEAQGQGEKKPAHLKKEFPGMKTKAPQSRERQSQPKHKITREAVLDQAGRDQSVAEVKAELKRKSEAQKRKKESDLFLKKEIQEARKGHFSEERLVREYEARHKIGKEVEHHLHHYVDQSEHDKANQKYTEGNNEHLRQEERVLEEERRAYMEKGKRKKVNPLLKVMRQRSQLRQAWLMKEVFNPKY